MADYVEQDNCFNCDMAAIKASLPFLEEVLTAAVPVRSILSTIETPIDQHDISKRQKTLYHVRHCGLLLQDDIVFASFRNGFLETPFLVAIDRSTSSVVVAIRGTLSISDVITDLVSFSWVRSQRPIL